MLKRWRKELKDKGEKNVCFDTVIRYLSGKANYEQTKKVVDDGPPWAGF